MVGPNIILNYSNCNHVSILVIITTIIVIFNKKVRNIYVYSVSHFLLFYKIPDVCRIGPFIYVLHNIL